MESSDIETVRRTAALARIEIGDEEALRLGPQFARILGAFRVLARLEVDDAPAQGKGPTVPPAGRLRPDEPGPSLEPERVLANAPEARDGFYSVPKTIADEP